MSKTETSVIETVDGPHEISKDAPVRTGSFGQIHKHHTTVCRYVKNTDPEDIKPLSEQDLEFHDELDECATCERERKGESADRDDGDRYWYDKATSQ